MSRDDVTDHHRLSDRGQRDSHMTLAVVEGEAREAVRSEKLCRDACANISETRIEWHTQTSHSYICTCTTQTHWLHTGPCTIALKYIFFILSTIITITLAQEFILTAQSKMYFFFSHIY